MYGLVNKAIQEHIVSKYGEALWLKVKAELPAESNFFSSFEQYDDAVSYTMVLKTSELTGDDASQLLNEIGRHWVLFSAREGYASFLELGGKDLFSFLANLNQMHSRVRVSFPNFEPPRFQFKSDGDVGQLDYFSGREGLEPFVIGLVEGLAERFGENVVIALEGTQGEGQRFRVERSVA